MYSITYNNFTLTNDSNHTIEVLDGISGVDVRNSEDFITGADGGNIWEQKLGMRVITIQGIIFTSTDTTSTDFSAYYALRATVAKCFVLNPTSNVLTVTKSDGTTSTATAKVYAIPEFKETAGDAGECIYTVVLKIENPYWQDSSTVSGSVGVTTVGGMPIPAPVPMPIGGTTNTITVINAGDYAVYPTILITGQITNPSVTNITTGATFNLGMTVTSGQTITTQRDTKGLYITSGGVSYFQYLNGDLFTIPVGTSVIAFSGTATDVSALMSISFTQAYTSL